MQSVRRLPCPEGKNTDTWYYYIDCNTCRQNKIRLQSTVFKRYWWVHECSNVRSREQLEADPPSIQIIKRPTVYSLKLERMRVAKERQICCLPNLYFRWYQPDLHHSGFNHHHHHHHHHHSSILCAVFCQFFVFYFIGSYIVCPP